MCCRGDGEENVCRVLGASSGIGAAHGFPEGVQHPLVVCTQTDDPAVAFDRKPLLQVFSYSLHMKTSYKDERTFTNSAWIWSPRYHHISITSSVPTKKKKKN